MMNRITLIIGLMICLTAVSMPAGAQVYKGKIDIVPIQLEQKNDSVYVDLRIDMSKVKVKRNMSVDLTPKLTSPTWQTDLPVISIKGRSNYKAYERGFALEGKDYIPSDMEAGYTVIKGYGKRNQTVNYTYVVPFESWMREAGLDLIRSDNGCGETNLVSNVRIVDSLTRTPRPFYIPAQPVLVFADAEAEAVKTRELEAECKLDFIVNRTEINPSYMNNMSELLKIQSIIDELANDSSISVASLEIVGYASPEGSLANNQRLSEGRAKALRDYIAPRYPFPRDIYHITFGGENWQGLEKALENMDMDYKDEVLEIIRTVPIQSGRESRIMKLRGGVPYRYMLKNIFPNLRTAICKIGYSIRGYDAQDALEVFRTRPANLSLNEFYMVANLMEKGSPDFVDVFETAVRIYPDDAVANLNAAIAALQNSNIDTGEKYLARINDVPGKIKGEYYNAQGVLSWLKGNMEEAEEYFRQSLGEGLKQAQENLDGIAKNRQSN